MPWVSVRAFSGALPSRRVPVRTVRCRARSVTEGQRYLGGWRLSALLGMQVRTRKATRSHGPSHRRLA